MLPLPESRLETKNFTYHSEFIPLKLLGINYDYSRSETPSVLVNGKNPLDEKKSTSVSFVPLSYFSTGWNYSESYTVSEKAQESQGHSNTYSADWAVISSEKATLNYHLGVFESTSTSPSGSFEALRSDTDILTHNLNLNLKPLPSLTISPGFSQQDYRNSTQGQESLDAKIQTVNCSLTYTPLPRINSSVNYNMKATSTSQVPARYKVNLGGQVSYRVFDWGDIVYNQNEEHNQGEVQAGGIFPALDYVNISRSLGMNLSIPQDNPIISAIVLSFSYKLVTFDNLLPGGDRDDFSASSVIFEGTLNF